MSDLRKCIRCDQESVQWSDTDDEVCKSCENTKKLEHLKDQVKCLEHNYQVVSECHHDARIKITQVKRTN